MYLPDLSFETQWYGSGKEPLLVDRRKSPCRILDLIEATCPSGNAQRAVACMAVFEGCIGANRVSGDAGNGAFDVTGCNGDLAVVAPKCTTAAITQSNRYLRTLPVLNNRNMHPRDIRPTVRDPIRLYQVNSQPYASGVPEMQA